MNTRLSNYIRAGYSGLCVVSHEETRVEATLGEVVTQLNKGLPKNDPDHPPFNLYAWSVTEGLFNVTKGEVVKAECDPIEMLELFNKADPHSIYLARDFHLFLENTNALVFRKVKDVIAAGRGSNKSLILLGCRLCLPPELEKEVTVLDYTLPGREQLRKILKTLIDGNGIKPENVDDEAGLVDAAAGLTCVEADQAFALSLIETGRITKSVVFREKCQAVRKNGMLEVVESKITLDDIGGLESLKKWLVERREAFGDEAKAYGLPVPRGFLAVGQPGTGKTLTAKACGSVFDIPLLRLDAAKLFGSLVGQSESNWRAVHAVAKAMAPCVLHIDEVDGAMAGSGSSGSSDGGTTARVIKSILQDMQDNSAGIFYVLTANDVDALPAPLLRRMDEVWNVELPNPVEREAIWRIQLAKVGRDVANFDLKTLVQKSEGYSGAEVEKLVAQSLYRGFTERREPNDADFAALLSAFLPLSVTMAADIEKRRKRLDGVAKLASGSVAAKPVAKPVRKISAIGGKN